MENMRENYLITFWKMKIQGYWDYLYRSYLLIMDHGSLPKILWLMEASR